MSKVEREPVFDVNLKKGESGVLMTTTITRVIDESFVDEEHFKKSVEHRFFRAGLRDITTLIGGLVLAVSLAASGGIQLQDDLKNPDSTGSQRDIAEIALAGLVLYAISKYGAVDLEIAEKQNKKLKISELDNDPFD